MKNEVPQEEKKHSSSQGASIRILGHFQVVSKTGNDISESFSPIIMQLLLACLLEQQQSGRGLSSRYLEELIWEGMDKASATNNRNVNIRKLRLLLQELGDANLIKEDNLWTVVLPQSLSFDYRDLSSLLQEAQNMPVIQKPLLETILRIALSGILLPEFNWEWADKYKAAFSQLVIDTLNKAIQQKEFQKDLKLQITICDVLLLHDNLDEKAIILKCRCLYLLGQKQQSKQCFDKYCTDYVVLLGETPSISYSEISKG